MPQKDIDSLLSEDRRFPPPASFRSGARIGSMEEYEKMYRDSVENREEFWAAVADKLHWFRKWDEVLRWEAPKAEWFVGGKTNLSYNCLDVHLKTWRRNKAAIIWEGEPGETRILTYQALHREVCHFANVLKRLGVKQGEPVILYMPMVPELAIAMLACARIGAPHSIIFGGFSAASIRDRVNDAKARVVITADGGWRRGEVVPLKETVDKAVDECPTIEQVVVLRRTGREIAFHPERDHWWHEIIEAVDADCPAEPLDAEHPLYILYTSGSTGKPKGVLHTTGGYMVGTYATSRWVFDLKEEDTYWCTADIGWVTGHSYVVYGILANGATTVMYEGAPNWPEADRFWSIVEKHGVTIFYTAPTAIRAFIKWGEQWPDRHDLSSLRLLGTVGEPINPEAWIWYHTVIGKKRCPIVDTWWQTETGTIMISPLPGATSTRPGSATLPLPGVVPEIVDHDGRPVEKGKGGFLVIREPWPAMLRTIYGDDERYKTQYWSTVKDAYFTGDGARRDDDDFYWLMGRVDDVINIAGHRLGTMEVESALVSHPKVAEAAVVGKPDEIRGEVIAAFVTVESGVETGADLEKELKDHVVEEIGAIARPSDLRFTDALPKTRSGKIMRRLLRDIAAGRESAGDTTTLEDESILKRLREKKP